MFSISPPALQALANPITTATIELYQRIVRDLPPTPSKFHYIFNLRDLSRIYHGLFITVPERYEESTGFVRVWRNECLRVFYDRLTNDKDRTLVSEHMNELLQQFFSEQAEVYTYIHICTYMYVYKCSASIYVRMCCLYNTHLGLVLQFLLFDFILIFSPNNTVYIYMYM